MQRLYLNPDFRDKLAKHDLVSFERLALQREKGELVATDVGRTTHSIDLDGETFYLKCVDKPTPASALESLITLHKPHHYCWREMQQVESLQRHNIAVMDVAAAGEATSWGIPNFSFILVREVQGESLEIVFEAASSQEQLTLLEKLGSLVGRLHRGGFFAPVRMKDVIVDGQGQFVLIDRETRKPGSRKFTRQKALRGLQRTMWRQQRDGIEWTKSELHVHLRAYLDETSQWLDMDESQLEELITSSPLVTSPSQA
jgi:tRNA A-37 threonylcarbamoyl transferase component Bud32